MRNGTAKGTDINQLIILCSHFGLSPIARMKVSTGEAQPKDGMDEYLHKPKPKRPQSVVGPDTEVI